MTDCNRCGGCDGSVLIMSFFNTDMICPDCQDREKAHPKYEEARERECDEVLKGNYNFPGIGKPADL